MTYLNNLPEKNLVKIKFAPVPECIQFTLSIASVYFSNYGSRSGLTSQVKQIKFLCQKIVHLLLQTKWEICAFQADLCSLHQVEGIFSKKLVNFFGKHGRSARMRKQTQWYALYHNCVMWVSVESKFRMQPRKHNENSATLPMSNGRSGRNREFYFHLS